MGNTLLDVLLKKLPIQNHPIPYCHDDNHYQALGALNYGPNNSNLHIDYKNDMYNSTNCKTPSPLLPHASVANYPSAVDPTSCPYTICKQEALEEDGLLVSSLPSFTALFKPIHSLKPDNPYDNNILISSYNMPIINPSDTLYQRSSQFSCPSDAAHIVVSNDGLSFNVDGMGADQFVCNSINLEKRESDTANVENQQLTASTASSSTTTRAHNFDMPGTNLMALDQYHNSHEYNTVNIKKKTVSKTSNNVRLNIDETGNIIGLSVAASEKKKKRKRIRTSCKDVEEMENQRMTHIAVERNRRKQMNEHLRALRTLMPNSYVQRADQASIVGATITFVEELEQVLQSLRLQKHLRSHDEYTFQTQFGAHSSINVPQYEFGPHFGEHVEHVDSHIDESYASSKTCMANVEVNMLAPSAIIVKVLTQKRPHQLFHTLLGLNNLCLKVMQLNVTTIELIILYSFSLQMEENCRLQTPIELAESIQHIFGI